MILPIIHYGDPVLRKKGAVIEKVTDAIRQLARDMIDTMCAARGLGLAAQQVGKAIQLAVFDVRSGDRPSQLFIGARETPLAEVMPLVLVNPRITQSEGIDCGSEGCLSFPEISGDIVRAGTVHVTATGLDGNPLQFVATGLLSRAVQHELDHLNGVLLIDRMTPAIRDPLQDALACLARKTKAEMKKKR
jgi:peptide deformylase